jgi:hypothetical protein
MQVSFQGSVEEKDEFSMYKKMKSDRTVAVSGTDFLPFFVAS